MIVCLCYIVLMKETRKSERTLNKRQLERIIIIHNAIKSGIYPDAEKLRRLYLEQTGYDSLSLLTIYRNIETLRVIFGAPVEYDKRKKGYYYLDENFDFALNNISPEESFGGKNLAFFF